MTSIFDGYTLRGVTLRNRIGVSPMREHSCEDGMPSDWHLVHLGSRASGGAGLVLTEAAEPRGGRRASPTRTAAGDRWGRARWPSTRATGRPKTGRPKS